MDSIREVVSMVGDIATVTGFFALMVVKLINFMAHSRLCEVN